MKLVKKMMTLGIAVVMIIGMSAVSYAQTPLRLMIRSTAPISLEEYDYQLDFGKAQVKHSKQISTAFYVPQQQQIDLENLFFYPGDTLYIPLVNSSTGQVYQEKLCPTNWSFEIDGLDTQAVFDVRWANESGSLNLAIDFAKGLSQSEPIAVTGAIYFFDSQNYRYQEPIYLNAFFGNMTRNVLPGAVNEIVSPMNLHAGDIYHGEKVTLSFGNDILFKDAVLNNNESIYLNLDQSFDNQIANQYRSFDIQCYNFLGDEDNFMQPGRLCLPTQKTDSYVYEVLDDTLKRVQSEYDEENGLICFTTDSLGYYIVSPVLMAE